MPGNELRRLLPGGYNRLQFMSRNHLPASRRQRIVLGVLTPLFLASLALVLIMVGNDDERSAAAPVPTTVVETVQASDGSTEFERGSEAKAQPSPLVLVESVEWSVTVPSDVEQPTLPARAISDLDSLERLSLPPHDFFETALRLGQFDLGERTVQHPPVAVGDRETFFTADGPRQAELLLITDRGSYWSELGLNLDPAALAAAVDRVEQEMLPVLATSFGREWLPGVDNDPRFHVLHVAGSPDAAELGYFTDENEFPRSLFAESNEREMVYLNMARLDVGTDLYMGTLVHELQHLIHWNLDPNEQVWVNEGLSQLAETMMGLDTVIAAPYLERPQIRLDAWTTRPPDVYAHYAGSYLFVRYLQERLGMQAVSELARYPADGMAAVQTILDAYAPGLSWQQFMMDFAAAIYLDDPAAGSAYDFAALELPDPSLATRARVLPFATIRGLSQLGVDYIDLDLSGTVGLTFAGNSAAPLTSSPPSGGGSFWFAPPGNSSRASLTAAIDLTGLPAPMLSFDAWYDLEPGWDFAYVSASADGGTTWDLLTPEPSTAGRYGPALGGQSAADDGGLPGWQRHEVSLAAYAGLPVQIRVEVLSDPEGVSSGVGLSALEIAGLAARGGELVWQGDGFIDTEWQVPQQWGLVLVEGGPQPAVHTLEVGPDGMVQAKINLTEDGATLVVVPLTPATRSEATYWLEAIPWEVAAQRTD